MCPTMCTLPEGKPKHNKEPEDAHRTCKPCVMRCDGETVWGPACWFKRKSAPLICLREISPVDCAKHRPSGIDTPVELRYVRGKPASYLRRAQPF